MPAGTIQLRDVVKRFGDFTAVNGIDLDVPGGTFFSLLGPSGCGKTTTLKLIGGFELPDRGEILLDGADMSRVPPHKRNVNTVFQNYALFPHLTVEENVGFGLRYKRLTRQAARARVRDVLDLVQLRDMERRRPWQLSGGQQQRVALARAIVLNPAVLLLDEPLGALDAKLRKALQLELKAIQREVGITFVYVTHDQEEALTMSDRIAVMSAGRVIQVGEPSDIYERPTTTYVADFLGVSNLMPARVLSVLGGGECRIQLGNLEVTAASGASCAIGPVHVVVRPERIRLEPAGTVGENRIPGVVERIVYVGSTLQVFVRVPPSHTLQAWLQNDGASLPFRQDTPVSVWLPPEAIQVLPDTS